MMWTAWDRFLEMGGRWMQRGRLSRALILIAFGFGFGQMVGWAIKHSPPPWNLVIAAVSIVGCVVAIISLQLSLNRMKRDHERFMRENQQLREYLRRTGNARRN